MVSDCTAEENHGGSAFRAIQGGTVIRGMLGGERAPGSAIVVVITLVVVHLMVSSLSFFL